MRALLLLLAALALSCTDEDRTRDTLRKSGFRDIHTGGFGWLECGEHDVFKTEFTATNGQGEVVTGVVCCGWLKSCTVRF